MEKTMRKTIKLARSKNFPKIIKTGREKIAKCLSKFLILMKEIKNTQDNGEIRLSKKIQESLQELAISIDIFNSRTVDPKQIVIDNLFDEFGKIDGLNVCTQHMKLHLKFKEIFFLCQLIECFKIEQYEGSEHFLFISEDRNIKTTIEHDFTTRDVTAENIAKIHDNWVPEIFLFETAVESMKWGNAEKEIEEGINIQSVQSINYIIKPYSEFGKTLFSQSNFPIDLKYNYYSVSSLDLKNWPSFVNFMQSLFVRYYIAFGNFYDIEICDECSCLFLKVNNKENKRDYTEENMTEITCSNPCYIKVWKRNNPLTAAREACFNNQREWLKSVLFTENIDPTSKICGSCPIDVTQVKIKRGKCDVLAKMFDDDIEVTYLNHTSKSYKKVQCRNRQNRWFSEKLQKTIYQRISFCNTCKISSYPEAGECQAFLEKYGDSETK